MAETGSPPIKGAFFGLLVMLGIFLLAGWLYDHFIGQRANAGNSVQSIAVYAPAVPESQWGNPSHGLRCKLDFETAAPSQFVDIFITVQYENITKNNIAFLYDPNATLKAVSAVNKDKWKLKLTPIAIVNTTLSEDEYKKLYESSVQTIKPGEIFKGRIECVIDNVAKDKGFISGFFDVTYTLEVDENIISRFKSDAGQTLWTGKIKAGDCQIFLTMPHSGGCNDCHGDADYHHGVLKDCRFCHAEGTAIIHETCIRCHKRDAQKEYGRRRVLGPEGDFDNKSKHIPGTIKDEDCMTCHDMTMHGYGTIHLIDPNSPAKKIWTGSDTEFCLSCHNSNPPAKVEFPAVIKALDIKSGYGKNAGSPIKDSNSHSDVEAAPDKFTPLDLLTPKPPSDDSAEKVHSQKGVSIYDKSDFRNSVLYKKDVQCTDCHRSHGSNRPSLLKNVHGPDDKVRI
jgi:hypothetical protein